jgi:uncharacterized protein (UPF0335 family)
MNNLKRDLKNLARGRREIFKEENFLKSFYNNREAQGKITKSYEKDFYKRMMKLKDSLELIDISLNDLFLEAQAQGFSVEDINILNLQALDELDLEEKQG